MKARGLPPAPPTSKAASRLKKELQDYKASTDSDITIHSVDDDIYSWMGYIKGPEGTPYEGGVFTLEVKIPPGYPYHPPKIKFQTQIWHPNISSQTGAICLDILKDEWSPAITIRTALLSIQALLSAPEPDDPQDAIVATMFKNRHDEFDRVARLWTKNFAKKEQDTPEEKISKLSEMGFTEEQAREALERHNWDAVLALNSLVGGG